MVTVLALGALMLVAPQGTPPKPSFVSSLAWMAGNWKSSASEYLMGGRSAGELDKTATVLMANANNSLVIRIASSSDKGKPYEPGELVVLHTLTDGKTTSAYEIVEIADEPVKFAVARDDRSFTLSSKSIPITSPQGAGQFSDKIVIEKKSNDQWVYTAEITYRFGGVPMTITQKLTFDRVSGPG